MKKLLLVFACAFMAHIAWAQNFPFPQNAAYPFGITATTPDNPKIQSLYESWNTNFYEESGIYGRIKYDNPAHTVSEGIGYGMLIYVYMSNATNTTARARFDKLYAYYKRWGRSDNYLMDWKINGFTNVVDAGSATDGDLDVALALVLAHKQWGSAGAVNYLQESENILAKIYDLQVDQSNKLIKPGDHWNERKNACYFTMASIGLFDEAQTKEGFTKTRNWSSVYTAGNNFLELSQRNGLWPDWSNNDGSIWNNTMYYWDACRTPWRIAWDYAWYGTTKAKTMLDKTVAFMTAKNLLSSPANVTAYSNLGAANYASVSSKSGDGEDGNSCFVGGLACAFMTSSTYQTNLNTYYTYLKNRTENYGYYAPTLQILYLLTLSGNTPNFYANSAPVAAKVISAETNGAGTAIYLSMSKDLKTPASNQTASFTLKINGATKTGAITGISLLSSKVISLTLSSTVTILPTDVVTISYTPGTIQCTDNIAIEAFANKSVLIKLASNNTLIADCEDANETKLLTHWYSYKSGASTIIPLSTATIPFTMTAGGANGTDSAAVVSGQLVNPAGPAYESVGIGFAFKAVDPIINTTTKMITNVADVVYDLTGATGISFWHKGESVNFSVISSITQQNEGHDFSIVIPTHTNWTFVEVLFTELMQESWVSPKATWDPSKIVKLQWQVKGGSPRSYTFGIDEVTVVGKVLSLPSSTVVNKTTLQQTITSATALHTNAVEGSATGQYPVGSKATLMNAINAASLVNADANATQLEVDAALSSLQAAVVTFEASVIGVTVSKTALQTSIANAQTIYNAAVVGTAYGQYPASAKTTLQNAITSAQAVNINTSATQTQVDNAKATLDAAVVTFQNSMITTVSSNTLIADCEAENMTKLLTPWYSYKTGASTISPLSSETVPFIMASGGANSTANAAVVSGQLVNPAGPAYESVGIGFAFKAVEPIINTTTKMITNVTDVVYDLTGATGISFWHKGESLTFSVITSLTQQNEGHDFGIVVPMHNDWTFVEVLFADLIQQSWVSPKATWDPSKVVKLQWQVKDGSPRAYSFGIDEVSVVGLALTLPEAPIPVNKNALTTLITQANTLYNTSSYGSAPGQYPVSAGLSLNNAISAADFVKNSATATQTEVDNATATLQAAINTFQASVNPPAVKTALYTSIQTAQSVHNAAVVGTGDGQYPAAAKTTLQNAITTAESVYANASATQTQVDNAKAALDAAVVTFQNSVITVPVDKTLLSNSISSAQSILANAVEGNNVGQYPSGSKSVLQNAITTAQAVYNNTSATQTQVDNAKANLDAAVLTFQNSVNTVFVNKSLLSNSLYSAQSLYDGTIEGTGNGQYPVGSKAILNNAIVSANAVYINGSATQTQVDNAKVSLDAAIASYQSQVIIVNKSQLYNSIIAAQSVYANTTEGTGNGQYIVGSKAVLFTAITTASNVYNSASASQIEVNNAKIALDAALLEYNNGIIQISVSELEAAINDAISQLNLATNNIGNNPGNYPQSAVNALNSAITVAQQILASPQSQVEVGNATQSVLSEVAAFIASMISYGTSVADLTVDISFDVVVTKGAIRIETSKMMHEVVVCNVLGRVQTVNNPNSHIATISTATYVQGVYFVAITFVDGSIETVKVVIK